MTTRQRNDPALLGALVLSAVACGGFVGREATGWMTALDDLRMRRDANVVMVEMYDVGEAILSYRRTNGGKDITSLADLRKDALMTDGREAGVLALAAERPEDQRELASSAWSYDRSGDGRGAVVTRVPNGVCETMHALESVFKCDTGRVALSLNDETFKDAPAAATRGEAEPKERER